MSGTPGEVCKSYLRARAATEWEGDLVDHDGNRVSICGASSVRVRDGKFTRLRAYVDPASFRQPGRE